MLYWPKLWLRNTHARMRARTHTRTRTHTLLTVYALHVAALYIRGAPVNFLTQFWTKGVHPSCVCLLLIRSCYRRTNATVLFMCSVSCVVATMQQSGTYAPALYNVYNRGFVECIGRFFGGIGRQRMARCRLNATDDANIIRPTNDHRRMPDKQHRPLHSKYIWIDVNTRD